MTGTAAAALSKGEQTRETILRAAVDCFGRDGFKATTVADITRHADVSGTLAYAYFENKEALFLAALDQDTADLIDEGVSKVLDTPGDDAWRGDLIFTLLDALERHPLAKRVIAGLEPKLTDRLNDIPALDDLRAAVSDRLRIDQAAGLVRDDIDPVAIGAGIVGIYISSLMAVVQFGVAGLGRHGAHVMTVVEAAIDAR